MDIDFILAPEAFAFSNAKAKRPLLAELAELFEQVYGLSRDEILDGLEEREALGSTSFGRAAAIPHCRSSSVNRPTLAVIKLEKPIDFGSADAVQVELVFGLVSPENAGATHLHALAAISRMIRDESMLGALMDAPDNEALYSLLTNQFLRNAA